MRVAQPLLALIGTFIHPQHKPSIRHRQALERELRHRSACFITDMAALGFSVSDVMTYLNQMYHKEKS